MSNASPAAGDTCAAGSQQGRADFNSNGRLDQSIFDNHGSNYQQCYEQATVIKVVEPKNMTRIEEVIN